MSRISRKSAALSAVLALAVGIAGAGGQALGKGGSKSSAPKQVEVMVFRGAYPWNMATENDRVYEEIRKKFLADTGIDIKFNIQTIAWEEMSAKYTLKMAAGERMDAIMMHTGILDMLAKDKDNGLRPIDQWRSLIPDVIANLPKQSMESQIRHGQLYAVPEDGATAMYYWTVRKDKLDEWGLKMPRDVAELERLFAAIKAKDPTCIPAAAASWGVERCIMALCDLPEQYWNSFFLDEKDGKVKPMIFHPNYLLYLQTWYRWVKNGWLSKDAQTMDAEQGDNMFLSGRSYIYPYWFPTVVNDRAKSMKMENPKVEVVVMPPIKGYNGKALVHYENGGAVNYVFPRTGDEEAQKAFLTFYNWQAKNAKNYRLTNYGMEGVYYSVKGNTLIPFDKYRNLGEKAPYTGLYGFFRSWGNPKYTLVSDDDLPAVAEGYRILAGMERTKYVLDGKAFDLSDLGVKVKESDGATFMMTSRIKAGITEPTESLLAAMRKNYLAKGGQDIIDALTRQYEANYKGK